VINPPVFNVRIFLIVFYSSLTKHLLVIVIHLIFIRPLVIVDSFNQLVFGGFEDLLETNVLIALEFNVADWPASRVGVHYEAQIQFMLNGLTFFFGHMRLQVFVDLEVQLLALPLVIVVEGFHYHLT